MNNYLIYYSSLYVKSTWFENCCEKETHVSIPNTILLFLSQTYDVCDTVTIVVCGTVNIDSSSQCSSLSVSGKLSSSSLILPKSSRSSESMEQLSLCIDLTAPGFLGNDALDDGAKESASENMTRTYSHQKTTKWEIGKKCLITNEKLLLSFRNQRHSP